MEEALSSDRVDDWRQAMEEDLKPRHANETGTT